MGSLPAIDVDRDRWAHPVAKSVNDDRPIKVICIGAGVSGILTAIKFPPKIKNLELVIYEKSDDIGGTWHENRYPGIACDILAYSYQFTFANNPNWSHFYTSGPEIQRYMNNVARRYDVERYVKKRHYFEGANWDVSRGKWKVGIKNLETGQIFIDKSDILIKATGILNRWERPNIPGIETFNDPTGKRITVIRGGFFGIQIVPQLQPKAARVDPCALSTS